MPVFQHNGALHAFIHVPKCAGTTVERMLHQRFGEVGLLDMGYYARTEPHRWSRTSPQHLVWEDFVRIVPDALIDRIFAVVRHPLKRFASSYNFHARSGAVPAGMGPEEWFNRVAGSVALLPYRADNHLRRQCEFVPDRATVFKLEDGLDQVEAWLTEVFGAAPPDPVTDANVATKASGDRFRSIDLPETLRLKIEDHYRQDYLRFGYESEPPSPVSLSFPVPHSDSLAARFRVKLFARRAEHAFRRIESRALSAATRFQQPKSPAS